MSDSVRHLGPALEAHQRFLTWLIPTLEKFPRAQRFLLGDRIECTALDVLESTAGRAAIGGLVGGLRCACPPYAEVEEGSILISGQALSARFPSKA
jgi:hypothetical protein